MTDTTKQRLINTGLFTEQGQCLIAEDQGALLGGEVGVVIKMVLRFNSSGELTSIAARLHQEVP